MSPECKGYDKEIYNRIDACYESLYLHDAFQSIYKANRNKSANEWFVWLLARGGLLLSTDPRYAVYGFLGLAPQDLANAIQPDYSITVAEVYQKASIELNLASQSLFLFSLTHYQPQDQRSTPTWVVDWRSASSTSIDENNNQCDRLFWYDAFRACGTLPFYYHPIDNLTLPLSYRPIGSSTLHLRGKHIDSITHLATPKSSSTTDSDWLRTEVLSSPIFAPYPYQHNVYITGSGRRIDVLWKTLTNDIGYTTNPDAFLRAHATDLANFDAWLADMRMTCSASDANPLHSRTAVFRKAVNGRRLFATERGYFDTRPEELRMGDQIYILAGGNLVYALRSADVEDRFELVGDCYLHGMMDGKMVPESEDGLQDVFLV